MICEITSGYVPRPYLGSWISFRKKDFNLFILHKKIIHNHINWFHLFSKQFLSADYGLCSVRGWEVVVLRSCVKVCLEHLPAAALGIGSCTGGKTSAGFSAVNLIFLGLFWAQGCCFDFPSNEAFGSPNAGVLLSCLLLRIP